MQPNSIQRRTRDARDGTAEAATLDRVPWLHLTVLTARGLLVNLQAGDGGPREEMFERAIRDLVADGPPWLDGESISDSRHPAPRENPPMTVARQSGLKHGNECRRTGGNWYDLSRRSGLHNTEIRPLEGGRSSRLESVFRIPRTLGADVAEHGKCVARCGENKRLTTVVVRAHEEARVERKGTFHAAAR